MTDILNNFLESHRVDEVVKTQQLLVLDARDSVEKCFEFLTEHNVHSAVVYNNFSGETLGIVDMRDFVCHAVHIMENPDEQYRPTTIKDIINISGLNKHQELLSDDTVHVALKKTRESHEPSHAWPVRDKEHFVGKGILSRYLTQTGILRWMSDNVEALGPLVHQKLADLQNLVPHHPVVCANKHTTALETFKLLCCHHKEAVPICSDGKVITNLSSSCIQLAFSCPTPKIEFSARGLRRLNLPLMEFLGNSYKPVVGCSENDTLAHCIQKMATENIRRLYVLDTNGNATGVLSCTDVINLILKLAEVKEE